MNDTEVKMRPLTVGSNISLLSLLWKEGTKTEEDATNTHAPRILVNIIPENSWSRLLNDRVIDSYKEPLRFNEEIDIEEWVKALKYSKSEVDDLLLKLLHDFELEPTSKNVDWLRNQINELITLYGNGSEKDMPNETRTMLNNLITKMAYDIFCIKNLI